MRRPELTPARSRSRRAHHADATRRRLIGGSRLSESGADQRHLFVWIDGATPFAIERALSHGGEGWVRDDEDSGAVTDDAFGLPAQDPHLDPAISHLWVVHERSARGWLWSADLGWRALEGLELRDEADFA